MTKVNLAFHSIFMYVHVSEWLKLLDVVQVILTDEVFLFQTNEQLTNYR